LVSVAHAAAGLARAVHRPRKSDQPHRKRLHGAVWVAPLWQVWEVARGSKARSFERAVGGATADADGSLLNYCTPSIYSLNTLV
jgi:hypothetical protein